MEFEDYLTSLPLLHTFDGGQSWNTGGFLSDQLARLRAFLLPRLPKRPTILETGAGNSTICFLFLDPERLHSIAPSLDLFDRIRLYCETNAIPLRPLQAHIDGSQWVLPRLVADARTSAPFLDFALIDGLHNWPAVFLDFFYVNFILREGGYLMIDDVQLHSVKELARLLSEQPGFKLELDLGKALVFRKTTSERELPEWVLQPYVLRRTQHYETWINPFVLIEPSPAEPSSGEPSSSPVPTPAAPNPLERMKRWRGIRSLIALRYGLPAVRFLPELKRRSEEIAVQLSTLASATDARLTNVEQAIRIEMHQGEVRPRRNDQDEAASSPLSDFKSYIVRKHALGVEFNYLVADETAQVWYDTPPSPAISVCEARSLPMRSERTGHSSWREMQIIRDHIVLPGSKVLLCGSHQGLTTILITAWANPGGFVYAFDAVLFNALVTQRNLELNGITNAAAYCAALGGQHSLANLYNTSNVTVKLEEHVRTASTVMTRIETVVRENIDVLILDIEGAELAVLEGSAAFVRQIPRLAIEVHTDMLPRDGVPRLLRALDGRPLHILSEDNRFEPYMGQPITSRVHLFSF
jgi:FkbM family methyltransferase